MKKRVTKKTSKKKTSDKLEERILQNLISLQKVHIKLATKFEDLSEQISNLLALFEMSARTFAKQPHLQETKNDKEFLEKIDKLLDQNKILAKGLTLMESRMKERVYGPGIRPVQRTPIRKNPSEI